jgi:hypothetical protein
LYQTANSYHNIIIYESEDKRLFTQNLWYSSGIDKNTKESFFNYIKEIKQKIIEWKYENIAIIWAAGFTLPQELAKTEHIKTIDVVDVDSQLKEISEKYFLEEKLDEKINFIIEPARYFLNNTIKKIPFQKDILQEQKKVYDVIVIDIYVWNSLPPQTLTLEFYSNLKQVSNDIFINLISDKNLESDFSKNVFATMRKAFWELYYKNVNIWSNWYKTNFVITNKDLPWYTKYTDSNNSKIYTDDKNSIEIDLFKNLK